ncbi:MAG: large subunit ribosomal protein L6, partial [Urechidicola sp.]
MSRIGKAPVAVPEGVEIKVEGALVTVKGIKGELVQAIDKDMSVKVENGQVTVQRPTEQKRHKAL